MNEPPSMFYGQEGNYLEKPLPHSEESEKAIIGGVLLDNNLIGDALEVLHPDDFYSPMYRNLYQAMVTLHESGKPLDPILISDHLAKDGSAEAIGGVASIMGITAGLPFFTSLKEYITRVRETSDTRKLIRVCNQVTTEALEQIVPIDELLEKAESLVYNVRSHSEAPQAVAMHVEISEEVNRTVAKAAIGEVVTGAPTGFNDLDFKLQGLRRQEQVVIAARPSVGKTALVLRILKRLAATSGPVLFFSLEMSKAEIAGRIICSEAKIDTYLWRSGHLTEEQWAAANAVRNQISEHAGFYIYDSPFVSLRTIRAQIRRVNTLLKKEGKPPLVAIAVDHIGLMQDEMIVRGQSRERALAIISAGLKQIARQYDLTTIPLSQINRQSENRTGHKPMMSDLRESGSLEQDADVVILIFREDVYQDDPSLYTNVAEIIVGKNRNGPTGIVKLHYMRKATRFSNLSEAVDLQPQTQFGPSDIIL